MPRWRAMLGLYAATLAAQQRAPDIAERANKAQQALRNGHFEEAARLYRGLAAEYPHDSSLHLNLAAALYSAGRYREALRELGPLAGSEKPNPKFWFLLGITHLKLSDPASAVQPLSRVLALQPGNDDARQELASTLLELRRFADAEQQYEALAQTRAGSAKVWHGLTLSQLGVSRESLDALKQTAPRSSYAYSLAAIAAADSGSIEKAKTLYQQALRAPPPIDWLQAEASALDNGRGPVGCEDTSYPCRFFRGDLKALASEVSKLRTAEALYWTTRVYAQLARQSMDMLAALPPSPEQHELAATLYMENGRRTEAIQELREAAKLRPDDQQITGNLAQALWAAREFEAAADLLSRLLNSWPDRADWQYELGDALFNVGKPEDGIRHLKRAVQLSPGLLAAQAKLGEALLLTGDAASAASHLELAAPIDNDGSIHFQLAAAYRKIGNAGAAAKALERQKELAGRAKAAPEGSPAKQ